MIRQLTLSFVLTIMCAASLHGANKRPNIILIMADDLGYGDVGYNANERIQTPHLDRMAEQGVVLDRFYTVSSICSPTRASVLTGRHPYRMGIWAAHTSGLRVGELTIAEILKEAGYATGFFGKWHLGWVKPEAVKTRGHYSPPWHHGFDEVFATTSSVPTWNPAITPADWNAWGNHEGEPWGDGNPYVHNGETYLGNLSGDDSRIIMDQALLFVNEQAKVGAPFFAVIWLHTPHKPVVAGPEYLALYGDLEDKEKRHYYGAITAMDEQIGRLRSDLEALDIADNTVIFFTSDNGPDRALVAAGVGSTGGLRGHKHTHYEGGIRVPSLALWPGVFPAIRSQTLSGTVDYLPTVLEIAGLDLAVATQARPIDGESLLPALKGEPMERQSFITAGYRRLFQGKEGIALISGNYKIIRDIQATQFELYDLSADPFETNDLSGEMPELLAEKALMLERWFESIRVSVDGGDYHY